MDGDIVVDVVVENDGEVVSERDLDTLIEGLAIGFEMVKEKEGDLEMGPLIW